MAHGPRYKVPRRRRREGKTWYSKRYRMVLSKHPRYVIRFTNKYVWVQIIAFDPKGDRVIAAAHSRELVKKYGWLGDPDNTSAAYLTGLLASLRALEKGVNYAVPDIGLHRPVKGARVFAAIKAANDSGLKVPCSEEMYPSDDRITGVHVVEYYKLLLEKNPELCKIRFSKYLERGLEPDKLPIHFSEVKNRILKEYGVSGGGGG
ncbi:MAG: 50S ribosomal protein L18 [Desulfurococcaceae archaeon]|uniref:Large ribosomal subunit protein uL18 n=1 Tax=Staphylothermus marinus TaxID=2280 RepID=A0A7C4JN08_STAMA